MVLYTTARCRGHCWCNTASLPGRPVLCVFHSTADKLGPPWGLVWPFTPFWPPWGLMFDPSHPSDHLEALFDPSHPSDHLEALCLTLHTLLTTLRPYVWPFTPFWPPWGLVWPFTPFWPPWGLMFDPSHPSDALCLTLHTLLTTWVLIVDPSHPSDHLESL